MYRSQKLNSSNEPNISAEEADESYEFRGATLKISADESPETSLRNRGIKSLGMEDSAILSGTDVLSPEIGSNESWSGNSETEPIGGRNSFEPANDAPASSSVSADDFFSLRPGQFESAVQDCINRMLRPANDTQILGSWLLTEVSHWDHERERIVILTSKSLLILKYDFIALRVTQHLKAHLKQIDTVLNGKLTYPLSSLVPRIEGIANGVTSLICGRFLCSSQNSSSTNQAAKPRISLPNNLAVAERFDFSCFNPVDRKDYGIRIMWNKGKPIPLLTSWNPFAEDIPWVTLKNHPVYYVTNKNDAPDQKRSTFSVESLLNTLMDVFSNANPDGVHFNCEFKDGPILMENYVGISAVIHNKNNFGFFKVRGKLSF